MSVRKYPICGECLEPIDPNQFVDCEKYYLTPQGEVLCRACFLKRETEYLELNTDDFAELVGVRVVNL